MNKSGKKKETKTSEPPPEFDNAGKHLQKLRTDKGLSIKEVSEITRISVVNLNAIENQDFQSLPADTFTRGFLTIYANFLGADTSKIVSLFMNEREKNRTPVKKSRRRQSREVLTPKTLAEPSHVSSMTMAGILLMVIIVLFTGFCLYTSWNPFSFLFKDTDNLQSVMQSVFPGNTATQEQPLYPELDRSVQESSTPDPEEKKPTSPTSNGSEQILQQEDGNDVVEEESATLRQKTGNIVEEQDPKYLIHATFLKNTRVRAAIDGQLSTDERFYAGDEKDWSADKSIHLIFSQGESASILVNGEPVDFPDEIGGVAVFQIQREYKQPAMQ